MWIEALAWIPRLGGIDSFVLPFVKQHKEVISCNDVFAVWAVLEEGLKVVLVSDDDVLCIEHILLGEIVVEVPIDEMLWCGEPLAADIHIHTFAKVDNNNNN